MDLAATSDDPTTHHDRIDFVYFKGKGVKLNGAKIVGENKENADIVVSPYPSDHRAVIATFTLPNQPKSEKLDAIKPGGKATNHGVEIK